MKHIPIRLGPLALLLTVISICMTTLSILAFSTGRADLSLASKYADTVKNRYGLEAQGMAFLKDAQEAVDQGIELSSLTDTTTDEEGVTWKRIEGEEASLSIGLIPNEDLGYEVTSWRVEKPWDAETSIGNLWTGE